MRSHGLQHNINATFCSNLDLIVNIVGEIPNSSAAFELHMLI